METEAVTSNNLSNNSKIIIIIVLHFGRVKLIFKLLAAANLTKAVWHSKWRILLSMSTQGKSINSRKWVLLKLIRLEHSVFLLWRIQWEAYLKLMSWNWKTFRNGGKMQIHRDVAVIHLAGNNDQCHVLIRYTQTGVAI